MTPNTTQPRHVIVVGTGLIGTSIALALRNWDIAVRLADQDPEAVYRAARLGAGEPLADRPTEQRATRWAAGRPTGERRPTSRCSPCLPPRSPRCCWRQRAGLARVYTDVASVKEPILTQASRLGCDLSSFVPGHPLAGGHQSGPDIARADLFVNKAWVLCPARATPTAIRDTTHASGMTR
jgi:prephenate dehydrogenase